MKTRCSLIQKLFSPVTMTSSRALYTRTLQKKITGDNITLKDIEILKNPTHTNISKLAFDYSDGIIFNSQEVAQELKEYAAQSGKPITEYTTPDEYINNYSRFFDQILEETAVKK